MSPHLREAGKGKNKGPPPRQPGAGGEGLEGCVETLFAAFGSWKYTVPLYKMRENP